MQLFQRQYQNLYPVALSSCYQNGAWQIWDPDFALFMDPDAFEKMERDLVVSHGMLMRTVKVAGREWSLVPGGSEAEDKHLASVFEALIRENLSAFGEARRLLAKAVFYSETYAFMAGSRKPRAVAGLPPMIWWACEKLEPIDKRMFRTRVEGEEVITEHFNIRLAKNFGEWERIEHPEWLIRQTYDQSEISLGRGQGLLGKVYNYWRAKALILMAMSQACDRFGKGIYDYELNAEAANAAGLKMSDAVAAGIDVIKKLRDGGVFAHDDRDKIKLLEGSATGWQMIMQALDYLDGKITIFLLGSHLPTAATTGGSLALGQVQAEEGEDYIAHDRDSQAEAIDRDLIGLMMRLNAPQIAAAGLGSAKKPRFVLVSKKALDPEKEAQIAATALAAGIDLPKAELYDRLGYSMPGPDEEVVKGRAAGIAPLAGFPGLPGMDAQERVQSTPAGVPEPAEVA